MNLPVIVSIQVGKPREYAGSGMADPMERPWRTGFFKEPVAGSVHVGLMNLDGDGQADLVNHGGRDKAICVYSADHYAFWANDLDRDDLPYGAFGENFSVGGLTESDVCLGDIWQAGQVTFEVSQPRVPCWKLARRWRVKDLAARVIQNGRTGWYLRVLTEGSISPGDSLQLISRPCAEWTIAGANEIMHHRKKDLGATQELSQVLPLADAWKDQLRQRVARLNAQFES